MATYCTPHSANLEKRESSRDVELCDALNYFIYHPIYNAGNILISNIIIGSI